MKNIVLLVVVLSVFTGCGVKKAYLKDSFDCRETAIGDIKLDPVTIIDKREGAGVVEFEIPSFSWKGVEDSLFPVISEEQEGIIKDEVRKHSSENGKQYSMTVFVLKGRKTLKAKRLSAVEIAEFSVKLNITDGNDIRESSGEALLEISSMRATYEYMEQLYRKAIREAIHKAIAGLKQ